VSAEHDLDRQARLVLERSDGSRLTLQLPSDQADRLDAICRAFLDAPR
jgi:hypothetical protein